MGAPSIINTICTLYSGHSFGYTTIFPMNHVKSKQCQRTIHLLVPQDSRNIDCIKCSCWQSKTLEKYLYRPHPVSSRTRPRAVSTNPVTIWSQLNLIESQHTKPVGLSQIYAIYSLLKCSPFLSSSFSSEVATSQNNLGNLANVIFAQSVEFMVLLLTPQFGLIRGGFGSRMINSGPGGKASPRQSLPAKTSIKMM